MERQTATTEGIRGRDRRILALPYLSGSGHGGSFRMRLEFGGSF